MTFVIAFRHSPSSNRLAYHSTSMGFILVSILSSRHSVAVWQLIDL